MKTPRFNVAQRRKREGKTNYRKRLKLLQSSKLRLVVRPSLNNILAQIVEYDTKGDKVLVSAHSSQLTAFGWNFHKGNVPAAYLTGFLVGTKAKAKGLKEAILDIGLRTPTKGSRLFSCLKGAIDAGLDIKSSEEIVPNEDRILGKHIGLYESKLKKENKHDKQFSKYIKDKLDVSQMPKTLADVKAKITKVK